MAYTTISANLLAHTTLVAGTYELTVQCNTGAYNLIFDCAAGNIFIKGVGAVGFLANGTGNITHINCTASRKVICTSANDDTRGEIITTSTGTPAVGDVTRAWIAVSSSTNTVFQLSWSEFYYCTSDTVVVGLSATVTNVNLDVTWQNMKFRYCTISGSGTHGGILGSKANTGTIKSYVISNISIDATCTLNDTSYHWGMVVVSANGAAGSTISNLSIVLPSPSHNGGGGGIFAIFPGVITISDGYFSGKFLQSALPGGIAIYENGIANINSCVFENLGTGAHHGMSVYATGGANQVTCNNCIAINCDGAGAYGFYRFGGFLPTLNNCGAYNCTTRTNFPTDNSPIATDPSFGNLPAGCVINTDNCPIPNGLAVTNLADYEFAGSNTFDNLGIDETQMTMTGWKYAGAKKVTPGIYYDLVTFSEAITILTPNIGTTAGGTPVAIDGLGFGATQGKFYFNGVEQTVDAWADDGPDITTVTHAAGLVDASCVNYRDATFTMAGAFTYKLYTTMLDTRFLKLATNPGLEDDGTHSLRVKVGSGLLLDSTGLSVDRSYISELQILEYTITASDVTGKKFIFSPATASTNQMSLTILGGPEQNMGADYTCTDSTTVSWNGLSLDGFIVENDEVHIQYPK